MTITKKPGAILAAALCFVIVLHTAQMAPALQPDVTGETYVNPVIDHNFADPSILNDRGTYYAYSTNSGETMPCEVSADLVHWTALPDAMPQLPNWARAGRTWAPDALALVPGKSYAAYFSAWDMRTNEQAIGVATASSPAGPFTSSSSSVPLVEQADAGGVIDPSCFVDTSGARYLLWKNDGNSKGQDTWLWIQHLSRDGLHVLGNPTALIKEDLPWEWKLVEAPTLWKHNGKYYLFYSANFYGNCNYAIGYAVSNALLGPYVKPRSSPFVAATGDVCGPGGQDIVTARDGLTWMAYHSWAKGPKSYRSMSIDRLRWEGDVPILDGPSKSPRPAPR